MAGESGAPSNAVSSRAAGAPTARAAESSVDPALEEATPTRPTVGAGSSGPEVVELQERLHALGFDPGTIDGQFGASTIAAVTAFQASRGLEPDGVAGPNTWAALDGNGA